VVLGASVWNSSYSKVWSHEDFYIGSQPTAVMLLVTFGKLSVSRLEHGFEASTLRQQPSRRFSSGAGAATSARCRSLLAQDWPPICEVDLQSASKRPSLRHKCTRLSTSFRGGLTKVFLHRVPRSIRRSYHSISSTKRDPYAHELEISGLLSHTL
jgi:hypothetical protein